MGHDLQGAVEHILLPFCKSGKEGTTKIQVLTVPERVSGLPRSHRAEPELGARPAVSSPSPP